MPRPWHWEERNGCGDKPAPLSIGRYRGQELMRCPAKLIPGWTWAYIRLWVRWRKGNLPFQGAVTDQPAWTLDALYVIDSAIDELESQDRDRASREARRSASKSALHAGRRRG